MALFMAFARGRMCPVYAGDAPHVRQQDMPGARALASAAPVSSVSYLSTTRYRQSHRCKPIRWSICETAMHETAMVEWRGQNRRVAAGSAFGCRVATKSVTLLNRARQPNDNHRRGNAMALAGTFRQYPLPEVLELLESGQRTGRLEVRGTGRRAHIYVLSGKWVRGERMGLGLTLSEQLIQAGLLTPEKLYEALGITVNDTLTLPDEQLLRMLFSSQVVSLDDVREWAASDAASMISYMLTWPDGEFRFDDGIPVPAGELTLPLPLSHLLARAFPTRAPSDVEPLSPEAVIAFADVEPSMSQPVQVSRDQWRLLSEVNGRRALWEIAETLEAPEKLLLQVAGELVANELAVIVDRKPQSAK